MRKFVSLFVLLAVLGLCVPSYGYVLIYKANIVAKGVDSAADEAVSISAKAFLVLDMDDTDDDLIEADMLVFGKVHGDKVYTELGDIHEDFARYAGDKACVMVLNILQTSDTVLVGQVRSRFVGVTGKKPIPGLVKGRLIQTYITGQDDEVVPTWVLDSDVEFKGYADLAFAWEESLTKKANRAEMTLAEVVDELATFLEDRGYVEVVAFPAPS